VTGYSARTFTIPIETDTARRDTRQPGDLLVSATSVLRDPSLAHGADPNAFAHRRPPPRARNDDDEHGGTDHPDQK
jgi:hypothetical protein